MDTEDTARELLERMLSDSSVEPTDMPLSLLKSITNNFSKDREIGFGGFAVVYKGLLQNGEVAVKKLTQTLDVHEKKFHQEVDSLMRVKHKNIVRFLGYCSDTQGKVWKLGAKNVMAEERHRFLCFEFLPDGSLDKYISDASKGLEWITRYQIIKGICEGLHYLHQQKIVHLDLKPANILLDRHKVPKIADFGLSKCFDEKQTRAMTSNVFGSQGYMAPEVYGGEITLKSDIYGLGIIVIEILTGQKGYTEIKNILQSWTARFGTSQGDVRLEPVRICAEIGMECTHFIPAMRPDTGRIMERLEEMEHTCGFIKTDMAEAAILRGPHENLESSLKAVDVLKGSVPLLSSNKNFKSSGVLNHVNNLLAKSPLKIEEEFRQLMSICSKPIEPDHLFDCLPKSLRPTKGDSENNGAGPSEHPYEGLETAIYRNLTLIPPRVLLLLNDIAQQLVEAGNQQACYKIYRDSRASSLELSLHKLGVEELSKDNVQKIQWEALEAKTGNWIHFMRAVKLLLAGERQICDQIFYGVTFDKSQFFAELTANSVVTLLSFGDAVARRKSSPEKLFVLLDMYEVMRELQSEIEIIFEGKPYSEMREAVRGLTKRLAQAAQETFTDFEVVGKDASETVPGDGSVHPLNCYVINYVILLFDYQSTLKLLFQEFDSDSDAESQLAVGTTRIMQALQNNLDGKSKQYKDPALTYLFLMNNIHYMVRSVCRSEAKNILGDDWMQEHLRIVQKNANQYRRVAWAKILQTLSYQGLFCDSVGDKEVSRIKERFKSFNLQFEELHGKQSQWIVPDQELRESLRLAVAQVLLLAYRTFLGRFGDRVENGKNPQKYVRYSPEAVDQLLGQFFEGQQGAEQKRGGGTGYHSQE